MAGVEPDEHWRAVLRLADRGLVDAVETNDSLDGVKLSLLGEEVLSETPTDPLEPAAADLLIGNLLQAAVVAGNVLDAHLKALANARGVVLLDGRGRAKSLGPLNDEFKRDGVYGEAQRTDVQAWLAVRNAAVHNRADEVDADRLRRMVDGVRSFIERVPARAAS